MFVLKSLFGDQYVRINGKSYELRRQIGEGAYAYVYKGKMNGVRYAIKKIMVSTSEQILDVETEVKALLRFKENKSIIQLLDYEQIDKFMYLVFPLYSHNLQNLIERTAYPASVFREENELREILLQIISATIFIHQHSYRHADLKPSNILLSIEGDKITRIVLADFGSCVSFQDVNSRQDALRVMDHAVKYSTASFRSPELYETPTNTRINGSPDVWALGCIIYNMLFSVNPFERDGLSTLSIMNGNFIFPAHNWSSSFIEIINKCLIVNHLERVDAAGLQLLLSQTNSNSFECDWDAFK
jgi:serine/threonine protein kinase